MTRKLIIHDGRSEREFVLGATVTVGRDPSCHISDVDPLLSRRHAQFVTTEDGCTVRDLGSRNGMLVNGVKVRERRLSEGDLVQLGHLQLRYTEAHTVAADPTVLAPAPEAPSIPPDAPPAEALAAASPTDLEDTRPHSHHEHASRRVDDEDITRAHGGAADDEAPTMAALQGRGQEPHEAADDPDATVAPAKHAPPASDFEPTVAAAARIPADPDATFVAGATFPGMQTPATPADPDATFVAGILPDFDRTIGPGFLDPDATFVAGLDPATIGARPAGAADDAARVTAGADLRVTAASAGCRALLGIAPETLIGRSLGDVIAERLQACTAAGPTELTFVVERAASDRSLTVTLRAAQAVETVS